MGHEDNAGAFDSRILCSWLVRVMEDVPRGGEGLVKCDPRRGRLGREVGVGICIGVPRKSNLASSCCQMGRLKMDLLKDTAVRRDRRGYFAQQVGAGIRIWVPRKSNLAFSCCLTGRFNMDPLEEAAVYQICQNWSGRRR